MEGLDEAYALWLRGKGIDDEIFRTLNADRRLDWATLYQQQGK
jgi:hypothetical protein